MIKDLQIIKTINDLLKEIKEANYSIKSAGLADVALHYAQQIKDQELATQLETLYHHLENNKPVDAHKTMVKIDTHLGINKQIEKAPDRKEQGRINLIKVKLAALQGYHKNEETWRQSSKKIINSVEETQKLLTENESELHKNLGIIANKAGKDFVAAQTLAKHLRI